MPDDPRAVFDCVIFLQAAMSDRGPSGRALAAVEENRVVLVVSDSVLSEIEDVLRRPRIQARFPQLSAIRISAFLRRISDLAISLKDVPAKFHYPRDPDDEPYVNLAIACYADFLVTRDRDLLDLANDRNADGQRLREQAPTLRIVDHAAFLLAIDTR